MRDPNCIFCKIVAGEIPCHKIYEDEEFLAFLDVNPISVGHTLLIPKEHVEYVFDLDIDTYTKIWNKAKQLAPGIQKATNAKRIGIAVEGFAIPHVHVHLVPINNVSGLDPNLQKPAKTEELAEMAGKIKDKILK